MKDYEMEVKAAICTLVNMASDLAAVQKEKNGYKELLDHIIENGGSMCERNEEPDVGIGWCYLCHPDGPGGDRDD